MAQRYKDKVTIVTGGGKGIGAGIVRTFFAAGSFVIIADRDEAIGKDIESELQAKKPGRALFVKCDVTSTQDLSNLVKVTVEKFGGIDCLINNAGAHPDHRPMDNFTVEEFRKLLDLNLVSVFELTKLSLPEIRKRQGNVINIASLVGSMGQVGATTYVATKAAIIGLTKALAIDESAHGVRINSVSPSNIWTPLWEAAVANLPNRDEVVKAGCDAQLFGRMGTIEEVGSLCLYLASDATFTTGVDHLITGGSELGYGNKTTQKQ